VKPDPGVVRVRRISKISKHLDKGLSLHYKPDQYNKRLEAIHFVAKSTAAGTAEAFVGKQRFLWGEKI